MSSNSEHQQSAEEVKNIERKRLNMKEKKTILEDIENRVSYRQIKEKYGISIGAISNIKKQ